MDQETLKHFELKSTEELTELLEKHDTNIYKNEVFEIIRFILGERNKKSERYMPGYVEDIKNEKVDIIPELTPPPIPNDEFKDTNKKSPESSGESKTFTKQKPRMFSNPLSFKGRIRRTEFGISFIIFFVLATIVNIFFVYGTPYYWLVIIPIEWFILAQGAKRCHDMGNSGWFQIIPFYVLWMLFAKGESGVANQYGTNPNN